MGTARLIRVYERQAWYEVLGRCGQFDVYHLPEYHLAVRSTDGGEAWLVVYEDGPYVAALPLLVRSLDDVPGLRGCGWYDAASAYGYPGLITNCDWHSPQAEAFRDGWRQAIRNLLSGLHVVAVFVRQHPLFDTGWMWQDLATVRPLGQTVVIDVRLSEQEAAKAMRWNHRRDIRDAIKRGIVVAEDPALERLADFKRLYEATMQAVNAEPYYFFPQRYYESIRSHLAGRVKLFFATLEGKPVAASMFFHCGEILQYHLSASDPYLLRDRARGGKLIIDTVRRWGNSNGFHWLHLGGGLGGRQDSLFLFKAGFSDLRATYQVVNCIVEPQIYAELVKRRFGTACVDSNGFFPAYRQPSLRRAA